MNRKRSSKLLGFLDDRPVFYKGERHIILVGGSGLGKTSHYTAPNIMMDDNSIIALTDIAGELSLVCAESRQKRGKLWIDNPHEILKPSLGHLPHGSCNPMSSLDPDSLKFGIKSAKIAAGCVAKDDNAREKYWQNTARGSAKATIMTESRRGEEPNLVKVAEVVHGDFFKYAKEVCAQFSSRKQIGCDQSVNGSWEIYQTLMRYTTAREDEVKSLKEVLEQLRTDTDFLLDEGVARSLTHDDFRYSDCRREVTSIFTILGIDVVEQLSKYFKLQLETCLSELINPEVEGDIPVTIYCDEYGIAAKGGSEAMSVFLGAGRKAQVTVWLSVIDLEELKRVHHDWTSVLANAGAVIFLCPITDPSTAEYVSTRCGQKDVYTHSLSSSTGTKEPGGSFSQAGRRVFTPAELAGLDSDEAIVFADFSKGRPMLLKHKSYLDMPELRGMAGKNIYYER